MKWSSPLVAGLLVASAFALLPTPVLAQDSGSMAVGNATVTVGGGTALLDLPDIPSLIVTRPQILAGGIPFSIIKAFDFSTDFVDETGWNANASISVPMTSANGHPKALSLNGFWARIEDEDTNTCTTNGVANEVCVYGPLVDDPTVAQSIAVGRGQQIVSNAKRDVDHWGVSLESKWTLNTGVMGVTRAPHRRYFALGADVRGIYQDLDVALSSPQVAAATGTYSEDLDTTYYGAYAAWGSDYSLPFLGGMTSGWGLQSSFLLRGGVYYADTDYEGSLSNANGATNSSLSLSNDKATFIGGLVLETRKRLGSRAMLSLKSEYEYYSYVPEMAYNLTDNSALATAPGQNGTVINDDDAFSARTSLRLTIGLGPDSLYQ